MSDDTGCECLRAKLEPGTCCPRYGRPMHARQHEQCGASQEFRDGFARLPKHGACADGLPSLLTRAKNATQAAGRVVKAAVTLHQIAAPASVVEARRAACGSCDKKRAGWCGVCGCALGAKQRLATETCPLGLWPKPAAELEA